MFLVELLELRKQLKELLDAGFIQPLRTLYGTLMLFQKKQNDTLCMCVDYRALKKVEQIPNPYANRIV